MQASKGLLPEKAGHVPIGSQIIAPNNSCNEPKIATSIFEDGQNMSSIGSDIICEGLKQSTIQFCSFFVSLKNDMFARECVHDANKIREFSVKL